MPETATRRAALARLAAASAATVSAVAIAGEMDPHPEWLRQAEAIRAWLCGPGADLDDEETDGPFDEQMRLEDLISETPASTIEGVAAQVALVLYNLDVVGGQSDADVTCLRNASRTLAQLAGGQTDA